MSPILGIWASQNYPRVTNSYESIATVTVGSTAQASITFSSIPSTFKHLQLRIIARTAYVDTNSGGILNFNSDSGANYAWHRMYGDGGTPTANGNASATFARVDRMPGSTATGSVFGAFIVDILDYANTSKNKTLRSLGGYDANGNGWASFNSSLWINNSAISSITFANADSGNLVQYSQVALYGIKG